MQFTVKTRHRQPHNIIIAAFNALHADHTYPFLDTVCSGLVIAAVLVHIMRDDILRQLTENNVGPFGKYHLAFRAFQAYTSEDRMPVARQRTQHIKSLLAAVRLAKHLAFMHDNGIGCYQHLVGSQRKCITLCLKQCQPCRYKFHRSVGGHNLLDIYINKTCRESQLRQQLPASGRL